MGDYIWPNPDGEQKVFSTVTVGCGFAKDNEIKQNIINGPLRDINNRLREDNN